MTFVYRDRLSAESRSVHVATLASIAIAQPLFDVLGNAPEFLLAHDLGPTEILAVVAILGVAVPLVCAAVIAFLARVHATIARAAATVMVSLFVTFVALYALRSIPAPAWAVAIAAVSAGAAAGVSYHRAAAVRSFTSWLSPGVVLIPLLFVLRPGVHSLIWPEEHDILESSNSAIPIVFVVFDGLPLTALLDEHRNIDSALYPSFAALGGNSTWYRNASTVSDYTQWSVPAMLSGRYPVRPSLPIASDHPDTLFTLLGSSHAVNVHEPISRLCPQSLCDHGGEGIAPELIDFAATLSVTYLHAILPEEVEAELPPIDQGWAEGVPPSETPGAVWMRGGDHSRQGEALAFINAIGAEAEQPSLHFLHVLLPHTPFAYLPDGQRYGTERSIPGLLEGRDRWQDDEWAVTEGYRRFLLQVGYVDTMLGQLIGQLKEVGLYDRALIVVTSDHGGSFKAGRPFRRVTDDTFMDIVPVPLFIKAPNQRKSAISDRNVETVDILPTIADIMRLDLPWQLDGVSAVGRSAPKADKTVYHDDAKRLRKLPATLANAVSVSVARKLKLFGSRGNRYRIPRNSPHHDLIERKVDDLRISDFADNIEFSLDLHGDFTNVNADGRFVPALLAGRARWRDTDEPAIVAVAINGVVRATTRTYRFKERGSDHAWSLLVPPDAFHAGENDVELFLVRSSTTPVLHRTHVSHARPVDLLSNAASYGMGVSHEGLYEREGEGDGAVRWTSGAATIAAPRDAGREVRSLRINLAAAGPPEKHLVIRANGCEIFEGNVPAARWSRIFALPQCGDDAAAIVIELESSVHNDPGSGRDLGVAVERVDLLEHAWPPPALPLAEADRRSQIRLKDIARDGQVVASTSRLSVIVVNRGASIWAAPADLGEENGAVRLGVLWFPKGQTARPVAVQRVELPRPLVPGDGVEFMFQLVPSASDGKPLPPGEYEAWIGLLQEGVSWFYSSGDSVRKLRVVHDARP